MLRPLPRASGISSSVRVRLFAFFPRPMLWSSPEALQPLHSVPPRSTSRITAFLRPKGGRFRCQPTSLSEATPGGHIRIVWCFFHIHDSTLLIPYVQRGTRCVFASLLFFSVFLSRRSFQLQSQPPTMIVRQERASPPPPVTHVATSKINHTSKISRCRPSRSRVHVSVVICCVRYSVLVWCDIEQHAHQSQSRSCRSFHPEKQYQVSRTYEKKLDLGRDMGVLSDLI